MSSCISFDHHAGSQDSGVQASLWLRVLRTSYYLPGFSIARFYSRCCRNHDECTSDAAPPQVHDIREGSDYE
jgi:hypothetical protein